MKKLILLFLSFQIAACRTDSDSYDASYDYEYDNSSSGVYDNYNENEYGQWPEESWPADEYDEYGDDYGEGVSEEEAAGVTEGVDDADQEELAEAALLANDNAAIAMGVPLPPDDEGPSTVETVAQVGQATGGTLGGILAVRGLYKLGKKIFSGVGKTTVAVGSSAAGLAGSRRFQERMLMTAVDSRTGPGTYRMMRDPRAREYYAGQAQREMDMMSQDSSYMMEDAAFQAVSGPGRRRGGRPPPRDSYGSRSRY